MVPNDKILKAELPLCPSNDSVRHGCRPPSWISLVATLCRCDDGITAFSGETDA